MAEPLVTDQTGRMATAENLRREAQQSQTLSGANSGRTVALLATTGFCIRNFLVNESFSQTLLQAGCRLLTVSPMGHQADFVSRYAKRGIEIVRSFQEQPETFETKWRVWRNRLHEHRQGLETMKLRRYYRSLVSQKKVETWIDDLLEVFAKRRLGSFAMSVLDAIDRRTVLKSESARYYQDLFLNHRVEVLFATAASFPEQWPAIYVARSMNIPVILGVLSWDNLSSKGRLPVPCTAVAVWGSGMAREVSKFYPELEARRIVETGTPQFDFHFDPRIALSRADFMKRFAADPSRPLLVYSGVTPALMPREAEIVREMAMSLREGKFENNPQLLVRLHPKDSGERYIEFRKDFPEVFFSSPGKDSQGQINQWEPQIEDMLELVNTLRHGDVHFNVASTMTIDAAVLDRPVVNIAFDAKGSKTPPWGLGIYESSHFKPLTELRGAEIVRSSEAAIEAANAYLKNPALHREGRRRIVELVCGRMDGLAGQRVAELAMACLSRESLLYA